MEVENNNNIVVSQNELKRSVTSEDEDITVKRLKTNVTESNGNNNSVVTPLSTNLAAHEDISKPLGRPPATQSPKKRLQVESKDKPNKNANFIYGNYKQYYGKRILDKDFRDIRLDLLAKQPELLRDKQVLDIGCNSGFLSIEVARQFEVKSLKGLDIDSSLVQAAIVALGHVKRESSTATSGNKFPHNVKFVQGNYVLEDDVLLEIERPQFDVILCLSVTKWIHLNFSDAGLKQAFRRMYLQLNPGGKLILEPQAFNTYTRRKNLSGKIRDNYNSIQMKPDDFSEYLLSPAVGFASMDLLGQPEHCKEGFKRPILIFSKT